MKTFDLIFDILTPDQWADWLTAPLERAAATGSRGLARRLVRAGAEFGDALHKAVGGGHGEIVTDLLGSGASIAAKSIHGETPLHVAAGSGRTEMVRLLLLKGADTDAFDHDKWTPLYLATYYGNFAAALALLAAGADVSLRCGRHRDPVMHMAAGEGRVEILTAVIEHGADVDAVDTNHNTALHIAAIFDRTKTVDILVEAGANIEARNRDGITPLYMASDNLSRKCSGCLLKHGANVNAQQNKLRTPLMLASAQAGLHGAAELVESLLRAGADETIVDLYGTNASDVIGALVEEEDRLAEDVDRVRRLLTNAPADKAWRRRGYLVLNRARQTQYTYTGPRTRSRARLERARRVAGELAVVVAKVLRFPEEGIFREIVGYL